MGRVKSPAIILCAFAVSLLVFVLPAFPQTVQSVAATAIQSICVVLAEGGSGTTSGTGFVVADGFVLTAYHVVQHAEHLRVLCPNHAAIEVQLFNADADNDVALMRNPLLPIRPLPLGDSARVQVGQAIVVIGFPRADLTAAETATVTQGIVSSVRAGALQIQAPVGPGNSGSPILTLQGQVIGVMRAVLGSQVGSNVATSFATGIDAAKPFLTSALGGVYGGVAVGNAPPARPVPPPTPSSSKFAITPGRGIGDLTLGMRREELEHLLGPVKHISRFSDGLTHLEWEEQAPSAPHGLWVILSPAGEVIMIGVTFDPRYALQGLHSGSREVDVRAALGEPSRVELSNWATNGGMFKLLYYDSLGLRVNIGNNPELGTYGLVVSLAVARSGCVFTGAMAVLQSGTCK